MTDKTLWSHILAVELGQLCLSLPQGAVGVSRGIKAACCHLTEPHVVEVHDKNQTGNYRLSGPVGRRTSDCLIDGHDPSFYYQLTCSFHLLSQLNAVCLKTINKYTRNQREFSPPHVPSPSSLDSATINVTLT